MYFSKTKRNFFFYATIIKNITDFHKNPGLYIIEFPLMGGGNQRVWRWGRKPKGEKREKKKI